MNTNTNTYIKDLFDMPLVAGSIKTAMKEAGAGSSDLWKVPVDELHIMNNFNDRVHNSAYEAHIRYLADSMKSEGFYSHEPLAGIVVVEDGIQKIYVTDGHSRLAAAKLAISEGANIETIPLVTSPKGTTIEDLTVSLARSNSGKQLTPYELGIVCKRLVRFGLEQPEIARRLGITPQYVGNLLSLMAAPIEIRKMVMDEKISASAAIETLAHHGENALIMLEKAQERANSSGKTKVTAKHIDPANEFKKACKAKAGDMLDIFTNLMNDKTAFEALPVDFQERIASLVSELVEIQPVASLVNPWRKKSPRTEGLPFWRVKT